MRRHGSGQLLDVVHDREELPLCADLLLTAERESSHALVLDVDEDRFDRSHAPTV